MAGREDKERKWEVVQIKAFKSWLNSSLQSKGIAPVEDLQTELNDGVKLIQFLEIVSGKSVATRYDKKPAQKIQKIQNINIALQHIQVALGVKLVGVGAEDVHDGNLKLILGMLWTLFRALRINSIKEAGANSEDALLLWVKKMTADYDGVNITNFKESFADGLAFSALIHKFDDALINYGTVAAQKDKCEDNLENAFGIAEKSLGIPKLLEAGDLIGGNPDERSVILYVSLFFHAFVANEERRKERDRAAEVTKKMTALDEQLLLLEEEKEELSRQKRSLEDKVTLLEKELADKNAALLDAEEKARLLESELEFMRQRALADAETIALLEEKNRILSQLLEHENLSKGEVEEARARLLAELEELRNRHKLLAGEKEGSDDLKRRLITENDKKAGILSDLETRKNALLNEIEQLRKLINAEMEKRKAAVRAALQLKKELDELKKKMIAQGKARIGLDILRRNLEEHLEDMYRWRELHDLTEDDQKRVFDLDKVTEDLKDKSFEQQLQYLDEQLQAENKSLVRIIRLKDSQFKLKEVEIKSGWLFMKGRKDWKRRWFSLRGFTLFYFENETAEKCEGFVDLNKGCEVVRQKAVKEDDSAKKQWPLKITVGERKLFVRAATKKERHSWYLFLASKIAHLNYLKAMETVSGGRVDTRLITLFTSEAVTDLHLDHRKIHEEGAVALAKTLPAHDETDSLSLINTEMDDTSAKHIGEVLEKLNIKSLNLSRNKISGAGTEEIAKGIATNASLTELNMEDNQVDNHGAQTLAANLALKPQLTLLNLNGNNIGPDGARALAEHLGNSERTLPELNLSRNPLGNDGAIAIANLLKANPSVTSVALSGCNIGNKGAQAIAEVLSHDEKSAVTSLDLSNNDIGNEGALAVEKLLKSNATILSVNLSNNKNITGADSLAPLLKPGFNFQALSINRIV